MKKGFTVFILLFSFLLANSTMAFAESKFQVYIDVKKIVMTSQPLIEKKNVLLDIKPMSSNFKFSYKYNSKTKLITGSTKQNCKFSIKVGGKTATIDKEQFTYTIKPKILKGKIFVPAKFIADIEKRYIIEDIKNKIIKLRSYIEMADGSLYSGEFKNNKPHGTGTLTLKDGTKYQGRFQNGIPFGKGKLFNKNLFFEGNFEGVTTLEGTLTLSDGMKYKGKFKDGVLNEGTLEYTDGSKYEGQFIKLIPNGIGRYISKNNNLYEGTFKDGVIVEGTLSLSDGTKYKGKFTENELNEGTIEYTDGSKYEGQVKNLIPNGKGKYTNKKYELYEGEFIDGDIVEGTLYFNNKTKYVGKLKNYKPDGQGVKYDKNSSKLSEGKWQEGKLIEATYLANKQELEKYLNDNYSKLNTSIGETSFTFDIFENTSISFPFDYWVQFEYNMGFFYDITYSIKLSSEQREQVKQELKDYQEKIAKEIINAIPNKKFKGGYFQSGYRYPYIREGFWSYSYYTWTNYDVPSIFAKDPYYLTTPSSFRWYSDYDDKL